MAISNNLLHGKLSGHIGKQLVFRQYGGKTVVSKYPDMSKRKFSSEQKKVHETMAAANEKVKEILDDDQLRAEAQVRLNVTSNKLYTALIKEYFREEWPKVKAPAEKKVKRRGSRGNY